MTSTVIVLCVQEPQDPSIWMLGGEESSPLTRVYMALIGYGDEEHISWQCAGSVISELFVISAAHCNHSLAGPARWVRLGELDMTLDTDIARPQQFRIVERLVHPDYRSSAFYSDVVLFRLERAVVFDDFVKPVCLYQNTEDPPSRVLIMGWGQIETAGPRSAKLLEAAIDVYPVEECKRIIPSDNRSLARGIDPRTMMCASAPGKNTCRGDSGGPLVLQHEAHCLAVQAGITSFGAFCEDEDLPGVYVRMAHFLPWIESVVWPQEQ